MQVEKPKKIKKSVSEMIIYIIAGLFLLVIALSYLSLFTWGILNCFKSVLDYAVDMVGLPSKFIFTNFSDCLQNLPVKAITSAGEVTYGVPLMLFNSLICAFVRSI